MRQCRVSDLEAGALRTWVEVAREYNARTGESLDGKSACQIGTIAIARLRRWIETEAKLRGKKVDQDNWRV